MVRKFITELPEYQYNALMHRDWSVPKAALANQKNSLSAINFHKLQLNQSANVSMIPWPYSETTRHEYSVRRCAAKARNCLLRNSRANPMAEFSDELKWQAYTLWLFYAKLPSTIIFFSPFKNAKPVRFLVANVFFCWSVDVSDNFSKRKPCFVAMYFCWNEVTHDCLFRE